MGWAALVLVLVCVVLARSQGNRVGGLLFIAFVTGFLVHWQLTDWWSPTPEQVPAPTEVVQVAPTPPPVGDLVPAPGEAVG